MARKNYEDDEERRIYILRTVGIGLLVVVALIIMIFMLKGCNRGNNKPIITPDDPVDNRSIEEILLDATEEYFNRNVSSLPKISGECKSVSLGELITQGFVEEAKYTSCDRSLTYVKVCKLENGDVQYVPFMSCTGNNSETSYGEWKEGGTVIPNSTDVKYLYQVDYLDDSNVTYGAQEEYWEKDIPYTNYKTDSITKYYRYADLEYLWNIKDSIYYPGDIREASKVKEYYTTSPASGYTNKSNENKSVAKYYSEKGEKDYWLVNGQPGFSEKAPDSTHIYKENPIKSVVYASRTWTHISTPVNVPPIKYWYCASPNDVTQYVSTKPCTEQTLNPGYTITVKTIYSCDGGLTDVGENGVCKRCTNGGELNLTRTDCGTFGDWSAWTKTPCNTNDINTCVSLTTVYYNWYKFKNSQINYYPSGSATAAGEKTYYATAPAEGLIRDETTVTTGWKWYKSNESQKYSTNSPAAGAVKTGESRWTSFSDWSTTKVDATSTRKVETKNKLKIRKITGTAPAEYKVFNAEYMTLEELLVALQDKGYKVYSLEDISINNQLRYRVKLLTRNKEAK